MKIKNWSKENSKIQESIKYSFINGITDAIVKALTSGPLLTVYAVGIGLSNLNIGLLQAILPFSNLLHLYVAKLLEKGYSPRKIAWISSFIARPFLLLIALSVFFKNTQLGIYLFIIPYIFAHTFTAFTSGAFWPWCKGFVPNKITTSYFALRTQKIILAKVLTFLIATTLVFVIHNFNPKLEIYCYSFFYVVAFVAGMICTYSLWKIMDVKLKCIPESTFVQKLKLAITNKPFLYLSLGIGLANFILSFYTVFNIVFLFENLKLTMPIVMCFTLFSNVVEITFTSIWKKYSTNKNAISILTTSSLIFILSTLNFIVLSLNLVNNSISLAIILITTAILLGISSSGYFIATNATSVSYVPQEMSSVYLSILNIGRFGLTGLGATSGGILLNSLSNNEYKWSIFFLVCIFLFTFTYFVTKKIKPVKHIS